LAKEGLAGLGGFADPDLVLAWNELGSAAFAEGQFHLAEDAFRSALACRPGDEEARLGLGYALFNQNRLSEAGHCFQVLPDHPGAQRALAATRMNLQDFKEAGSALDRSLALNPKDAESLALKGLLAYRESEADSIWRHWTRHNLANPKDRPDMLAGRIEPKRLEEAIEALRSARRIDARIRTDELGARLLTVSGKPEAALEFLGDCPEPDGRTWQWMADISWLLRDEKAAKRYLGKSFEARMDGMLEARPLGEGVENLPSVAAGLARAKTLAAAETPLVWLHWDAPAYFAHSIASAIAASPASPRVVLGDSANNFQHCRHMPLMRRSARAFEFLESYRHASENDYVYEAFCLMRWFFLLDWAEVAGVERLATLDSDILLFADLETELVPRLQGRDLAFTGPMGPHLAILTQKGLVGLCDFLTGAYAKGIPEIGGQVSDMTLLPVYLRGRDFADLSAIEQGARVDMNIRQDEGFAMAGDTKEIRFQNGQAFAKRQDGGDLVRLLALHFQGKAKIRMAQALACEDLRA
jgi:tetratricopeptide (TPR) repeat protein